jgi:hypothetical protein
MLTVVSIVADNYGVFPYVQLFLSKSVLLELLDKLWSLLQIGAGDDQGEILIFSR